MAPLTKEQLAFLAERLPELVFMTGVNNQLSAWLPHEQNTPYTQVSTTEYAHLVGLVEGQLSENQQIRYIYELADSLIKPTGRMVISLGADQLFRVKKAPIDVCINCLMTVLK